MQIYVMNSDGTGQTRLTTDGSNNDNPRWSPNGAKILFQSDRDNPGSGLHDIYAMNADGSGQIRLTADANDDCNATWSPDGSKIVFQSSRNGLSYQIYTMNSDGSGQVNISNSASNDTQPSWSSDGAKIAFASDRDQPGSPNIYVMNSNGSNQTRLTWTNTGLWDEQPIWSPDRTKIAFTSTRDSATETWQETDDDGNVITKSKLNINKEVYVMTANGSSQTRLTNDLSNDDSACWSTDGTKIVFRSERDRDLFDPSPQIWTMNSDGTNQTNLSNSGDGDFSPSWSSSYNQSPVANAGGPYNGIVSQTVTFNAGGSFDPDGTITGYSWTFGDGGTGSGATPTHSYASAGNYNATVTVTDNFGATNSATAVVTVYASVADQYTQNFYQWAVLRQPNGEETNYWMDIFRAAYAHQQASMTLAVREMGKTIFESAEYAARNRNDHWYVYDLYKAYLMREPDAQGWANWEATVPLYGREHVRRGFDESTEFMNLVATITPSGSPSAAVTSLAAARVDLFNQSGNQLQARDAEWGVNLISLPGRAGLDLGLGLSYSSLVWTRSGPYAYFDEDHGSPSAGFHIGFPTIQEEYFDAQVGANVLLLRTAAGRTIELRQVGTSNIYESADSSHLQLIANGSLLLRATDGTQMTFNWISIKEYRCTSIEDRNGNYMLINYDWRGDIQNVTDTLGRVINFVYDANSNPACITQGWNGQPAPTTCGNAHTWVTFGWDNLTMQPTLTNVVGTYGGETIPVLKTVGFDDGTYTKFLYGGNGQATRITQYAPDDIPDHHPRNYTAFDYDSATDNCPRLTATRTWADYWTGVNGVPTEVTTQFGIESDKHTVSVVGDPNGTVYKESYASSTSPAWQHGLILGSEVWAGGSQQKVTTAAWTQDNAGVNYKTNPRVIETNIYDSSGNRRRTVIDYSIPAYAQYGLPYFVTEYAADGSTELRRTYTDYNLAQPYLDHRIIGLVSAVHLTDAAGYQAKVTYGYDDPARISSDANTAAMHDQNYHASFTVRGNVTTVSRWDVTDITNWNKALTTWTSYSATGSVVTSTDPSGHTNSLSYSDSFSDGNNGRDTFAYPTTLTDADNFSSFVQYNFDFGAKTRFEGPPPQNQPNGLIQTFTYDGAARLQRVTTANTGAYMHYVYGPFWVQSFSSVNNVAANYWDSDIYSIEVFDGVGRVFTTTTNHPGSSGGYKLVNTIYDRMGRPIALSNPTEVDSSWLPIGDDDAVHYSTQSYDWKGRTRITTRPDGTYTEASYAGCGCAGGEVVTLTDEMNRQQRMYSDVLGRHWKTELLSWPDVNNNRDVYETTTNTYNARDQVTLARSWAGVENGGGAHQDTIMSYDGYGRLRSKHLPEQDAGTATTWDYNPDNTLQQVTDARGARASYGYNNRHLVTSIDYLAPAGALGTASVLFGYDAAGNRTSMSDGLGSVSYNFDSLSRMTSETRYFGSPLNQSFTLGYDFNLTGQLKTITDPWGSTINYGFDSVGRLNNITGSGYGSTSQFVNNAQYRAWGTLKSETYGNGFTDNASYNVRMQMTSFDVRKPSGELQMSTATQFYPNGQVKQSHNALDERFDRAFGYDHLGRMVEAYSGSEARDFVNSTNSGAATGPYRQSFQFSPFNQVTQQTNRLWSDTQTTTSVFANNRMEGWLYDAAGFATSGEGMSYARDAAGRNVEVDNGDSHAVYSFDGDGRMLKAIRSHPGFHNITITSTIYYLNSTVLGRLAIAELGANGQKIKRYVYAGSRKLAEVFNDNTVSWSHEEPVTGSRGDSTSQGTYLPQAEFNANGINVGFAPPVETGFETPEPVIESALLALGSSCSNADPNCQTCYLDGFEMDCNRINWEAAEQCPNNDCGPRRVPDKNGNPVLVPLTRNPNNGMLGYWPDGYNAAGVIHDAMGRPIGLAHDGPSAPAGGGTPIYGAFRVDVSSSGTSITGDWQYYVVGYTTPIEMGTSFVPQAAKDVPLQTSDELRSQFKKLLSNKKCADFVAALIATAESYVPENQRLGMGFEDLFENIAGQGGYILVKGLNIDGTAVNALVDRGATSIWNGNAQVQIRTRGYYTDGSPAVVASRLADNRRDYLASAFHETFHHIARSASAAYSDQALGEAAFKITGDTSHLPGPNGTVLQWSSYFHNQLMKQCMPDRAF